MGGPGHAGGAWGATGLSSGSTLEQGSFLGHPHYKEVLRQLKAKQEPITVP